MAGRASPVRLSRLPVASPTVQYRLAVPSGDPPPFAPARPRRWLCPARVTGFSGPSTVDRFSSSPATRSLTASSTACTSPRTVTASSNASRPSELRRGERRKSVTQHGSRSRRSGASCRGRGWGHDSIRSRTTDIRRAKKTTSRDQLFYRWIVKSDEWVVKETEHPDHPGRLGGGQRRVDLVADDEGAPAARAAEPRCREAVARPPAVLDGRLRDRCGRRAACRARSASSTRR